MRTLAALFLASVLAAPVAAAGVNCVIKGPREFFRGSQQFCSTGLFSTVKTEWKGTKFLGTMTLSELGFKAINTQQKQMFDAFAHILSGFSVRDREAAIDVYFGEKKVIECSNNLAKQTISCERLDKK